MACGSARSLSTKRAQRGRMSGSVSQGAADVGSKLVSAEQALAAIRPGSRIFLGTGCAAPRKLLATLEAMSPGPADLEFVSFVTTSAVPEEAGVPHTRYRHRAFFVGSDLRGLAGSGRLNYVPIALEDVPELLASGKLPIDDGSTLQIGLGRVPNEALRHLKDRRDLGIHSDVITDGVVDLVEAGVVTNRRKTRHRDRIVASYCLGTRRLYDFLDDNPLLAFLPIDQVCDPQEVAGNARMVSITQAFAVDMTGQVCVDQFEGEFYGGVSTQAGFIRGAARSPGGKPIICLASTTDDGTSRIKPLLETGDGVGIARSDVHYVVTEYGIAYLFGKSIRERALALIDVAHPNCREDLLAAAKRLGYVLPEQYLASQAAYPVHEERTVQLKNGVTVLIRPARASDAGALLPQLHRLTPDQVYTRFFRRVRSLSYAELQTLCNVNHETEVAFLAVTGPRESEVVVGSACYFLNSTTNLAEIAFMVAPEWQGQGLGTALQARLQEYAIGRGVRGFVAEMLPRNARMLRLATHAPGTVSTSRDEESVHVTILFQNKAPDGDAVASENFMPSRSLKFQNTAPDGSAMASTRAARP